MWLVIEDTGEEKRPFKFYFSNLPNGTSLKRLVTLIKLRWRIERDYQELKGELGLDHFEGRSWRGFHHHATLCAVAHGFLALRRALPPLTNAKWTLAEVRRHLQQVLLQRIGWCPLCARTVDDRSLPRAPSRL